MLAFISDRTPSQRENGTHKNDGTMAIPAETTQNKGMEMESRPPAAGRG